MNTREQRALKAQIWKLGIIIVVACIFMAWARVSGIGGGIVVMGMLAFKG